MLPSQLTSLSITTRYMIEEMRNLRRIRERRLITAEEMFIRFEEAEKT